MKFSENWLREWVNPDIATNELIDQLTMAGLEVEGFESVAPELNKVVIGEIIQINQHPDADKLQITLIDVGQAKPLQIVCGAKNIYVGMKVPVAMVGAVLPGDFEIKEAKLRGTESFGMLCSEKELGLADDAQGIMDLVASLKPGTDFSKALQLDDNCIELDLTPNRGDCLSIRGVARELGVINRLEVKAPGFSEIQINSSDKLNVEVEDSVGCPCYLGRVINDIDINAKTPLWMQEKLRRGGIRSIAPLVDVTNYVMLELGQPLHAFDLAQIDEKIIVRKAKSGEKLKLLDGKELALDADTLLIADNSKILALAGIMGGEASGISSDTKSIFLECAFFNPLTIAGVARKYGIHTDSAHRFERGVDSNLQNLAIDRATELLLEIVGGKVGEIACIQAKKHLPKPKTIHLKPANIKRLLGVDFSKEEIQDILQRLGMTIESTNDDFKVTAPGWRFDIKLEADLIEELGRIYGYDKLPVDPINLSMHLPVEHENIRSIDSIKQYLVDRDYFEAVSYSFVDEKILNILGLDDGAIVLANPIASDMSAMRTSLMPGLIKAQRHNLNRQHKRIRLFETGLRFYEDDNKTQQIETISGLVCGSQTDEQWGDKSRDADFYDVKNDLEQLLGNEFTYVKAHHSALHPGQTASININGKTCGHLGKIHPQVAKKLEIPANTILFEIDFAEVLATEVPKFKALSKFPMLRRDLSIVLDNGIVSDEVVNMIKAKDFDFVQDVRIFDVYSGDSLGADKYSLALALELQHSDRTLNDEDIDNTLNKVINTIKLEFNAELRD